MHRSEQTDPHHLRNATRIVAVGLVHLRFQEGFCMPGLDADRRQAGLDQAGVKPLRQWPSFEPDAHELPRGVLQGSDELFRVAGDFDLVADRARFIHDAHRRLFHRDIQSGIILHAALPFLMLVAVPTDHVLSSARSAAPRCITAKDGLQAEYPICLIFAPLKGYDEPEILPSQLSRFCLIGADAGHAPSVNVVWYHYTTIARSARLGRANRRRANRESEWQSMAQHAARYRF